MLLGIQHDQYPTTEAWLAPGSVLALYTDGLVEQPGQDIDAGMSRLARTLAATPALPLDHVRDTVLASPGPYPSDDIALLLARTDDVIRGLLANPRGRIPGGDQHGCRASWIGT